MYQQWHTVHVNNVNTVWEGREAKCDIGQSHLSIKAYQKYALV